MIQHSLSILYLPSRLSVEYTIRKYLSPYFFNILPASNMSYFFFNVLLFSICNRCLLMLHVKVYLACVPGKPIYKHPLFLNTNKNNVGTYCTFELRFSDCSYRAAFYKFTYMFNKIGAWHKKGHWYKHPLWWVLVNWFSRYFYKYLVLFWPARIV